MSEVERIQAYSPFSGRIHWISLALGIFATTTLIALYYVFYFNPTVRECPQKCLLEAQQQATRERKRIEETNSMITATLDLALVEVQSFINNFSNEMNTSRNTIELVKLSCFAPRFLCNAELQIHDERLGSFTLLHEKMIQYKDKVQTILQKHNSDIKEQKEALVP